VILDVDLGSAVPPYEQIRAQVTALARVGALPAGLRLPSIRQLAADLGVASGTVARAYRELENDHVVVARGRHGTTIVAGLNDDPSTQQLLSSAGRLVGVARTTGSSLDNLLDAVRAAWALRPEL
jgi:GntR family transcriptional regulator